MSNYTLLPIARGSIDVYVTIGVFEYDVSIDVRLYFERNPSVNDYLSIGTRCFQSSTFLSYPSAMGTLSRLNGLGYRIQER